MSRPYYMPSPQFRADLHAEELIHQRISECDQAFASGDVTLIQFAVMALENHLLGEDIATPDFIAELQSIEDEWKETLEKQTEEYQKKCEASLAPDVIQKPSQVPPLDYWRRKYIRMKVLISNKGMWLQKKKTMKY